MRPNTKQSKEASSNNSQSGVRLTKEGYTLLAEIRDKLSARLHFNYGLGFEDSRDLAGELAARCCSDGLAWLCSEQERASLTEGKLAIEEKVILGRMLRAKFLSRKSTDFVRRQHAGIRDSRLTTSLDQTEEVDGEEQPLIQVSYDEEKVRNPYHGIEAKDELNFVGRTVMSALPGGQQEIFKTALENPESLFHSADLAFLLTGKEDSKIKKKIASRTGEVKDEIHLQFRMKSGDPRPHFSK